MFACLFHGFYNKEVQCFLHCFFPINNCSITGIFAPLSKIAKPGSLLTTPSRTSLQRLNYGKVDVAHVTAKVNTGKYIVDP